jgi:hypothetical protein
VKTCRKLTSVCLQFISELIRSSADDLADSFKRCRISDSGRIFLQDILVFLITQLQLEVQPAGGVRDKVAGHGVDNWSIDEILKKVMLRLSQSMDIAEASRTNIGDEWTIQTWEGLATATTLHGCRRGSHIRGLAALIMAQCVLYSTSASTRNLFKDARVAAVLAKSLVHSYRSTTCTTTLPYCAGAMLNTLLVVDMIWPDLALLPDIEDVATLSEVLKELASTRHYWIAAMAGHMLRKLLSTEHLYKMLVSQHSDSETPVDSYLGFHSDWELFDG